MPGVVMLKWALNLLCALAIASPIFYAAFETFGSTAAGESLGDGITIDQLEEFRLAHAGQFDSTVRFVAFAVFGYLVLQLFLTGGVLETIRNGERLGWRNFFGACGARTIPLLIIAIQAMILFAVFVAAPLWGMNAFHDWFTRDMTTSTFSFYFTFLKFAIVFILISWVARVHDYARAFLVMNSGTGPIRAFGRGLWFIVEMRPRTFILWLPLVAIPLFLIVAHGFALYGIEEQFGRTGEWALLGAFVVGQFAIVLREIAAIARLAAQLRFVQGAYAEDHLPLVVPEVVVEPGPERRYAEAE